MAVFPPHGESRDIFIYFPCSIYRSSVRFFVPSPYRLIESGWQEFESSTSCRAGSQVGDEASPLSTDGQLDWRPGVHQHSAWASHLTRPKPRGNILRHAAALRITGNACDGDIISSSTSMLRAWHSGVDPGGYFVISFVAKLTGMGLKDLVLTFIPRPYTPLRTFQLDRERLLNQLPAMTSRTAPHQAILIPISARHSAVDRPTPGDGTTAL